MSEVVMSGGCIRFDTSAPRFHINEVHKTHGIHVDSLALDSAGNVTFELIEGLPVISTYVTADETLVGRGISGGISGGVGLCVIKLHLEGRPGTLDLNNPAHYEKVFGSTANLWVAVFSLAP